MPKHPLVFPYPKPAMPDEMASELRSFYDGACMEQESVNGWKEWREPGPSPEGFYHPQDIAEMTIESIVRYDQPPYDDHDWRDEVVAWLAWG